MPPPTRSAAKANVEAAIDMIVDYGRELADDERWAIIDRIAKALGFTLTLPTPPAERPARKKRPKIIARVPGIGNIVMED